MKDEFRRSKLDFIDPCGRWRGRNFSNTMNRCARHRLKNQDRKEFDEIQQDDEQKEL